MKKRLLSLLLCAVMLFACAAPAFAARPAASINKVTPPELPVSEYPLIIVRGMQLNGMVRYGGTEKEEKASVNFNAADLLKTLVKIPSAFITGGKDKVVDVLLDYAYGLFGHMGCDENGGPSDPDVSMRTFEGSAVNYPDLPGEPSVRQLGLFTSALHHYGAENLYFFSYDWRLDTYGNAALLAQEIDRALELVSAKDVVAKLEKGLDTDVGEGGDMLSTGEKQLISFARAILADPRILVLDEATASVDTITEQKIQAAIDTIIRGRTSIVIAHRLSTVRNADVILVVKDGKIVERGRHEELMAAKGVYYRLYTRQYEDEATYSVLG